MATLLTLCHSQCPRHPFRQLCKPIYQSPRHIIFIINIISFKCFTAMFADCFKSVSVYMTTNFRWEAQWTGICTLNAIMTLGTVINFIDITFRYPTTCIIRVNRLITFVPVDKSTRAIDAISYSCRLSTRCVVHLGEDNDEYGVQLAGISKPRRSLLGNLLRQTSPNGNTLIIVIIRYSTTMKCT